MKSKTLLSNVKYGNVLNREVIHQVFHTDGRGQTGEDADKDKDGGPSGVRDLEVP
jgi:hypothetical protein